ncbi:MAG: propanediol utilization protein [Gracilibacter sp. BRH_c7a]|nr:MAG: propanediol utilization protein [Gracilibacter sp. BRH_c7a]
MSEILFFATYPELAQFAHKVCDTDDVTIVNARMDEAVKQAWSAEKKGYQVIITRGFTSLMIRNSGIELPVVDVSVSGYDIVRAYYQAKKIGDKVGIIDTEDVIFGVDTFEEIIEDKIIKYTCSNDLDDISKGVKYLKDHGVEVVIAKVAMANEARKQDMKSVIITSGYDAVRRAICEAKRVNSVRKQEKRKAEQLKAILNFTYDGIIALDDTGKITAFNRVAEQLSGWKAENALGRFITEVIPKAHFHRLLKTKQPEIGEFLEIGSSKVVANGVPIMVDNRVEGIVSTFQQIDRLQKLESKVRRQLSERGLAAKYQFQDITGKSAALIQVISLAKEYSGVDSTILIYGQTGSGKEMFAHAVHNASKRRNEPFVAINCAALPESLLESELFGYVEGAFTGARKGGKAGMFEMAHGGTLFLDEVGEMSPMLQARLLRVIEQGEVMRLGDSSIVPVNVRLIAATHRDLRKMVENQEFREDLYYRLNVLSLKIPPLKYRDKDIISIAYQFLAEFCSRRGKPPGKFTPEAEKILLNYSWPGNIRELRNAMERLGMRPWKNEIGFMDVSKALLLDEEEDAFNLELSPESSSIQKNDMYSSILDKRISTVEKHVIQKVLQECEGKKAEAARRLGISRTTLWRKSQD